MHFEIGKIACAAAIINQDKKILLLQRSLNTKSAPGEWTFPAGKLDPSDESVATAVVREVKEETNLDFTVTERFKFYDHTTYGMRNMALVHLGIYSGDLILNEESIDAKWFSYEETQKLKVAFSYPDVLNDLYKAEFIA